MQGRGCITSAGALGWKQAAPASRPQPQAAPGRVSRAPASLAQPLSPVPGNESVFKAALKARGGGCSQKQLGSSQRQMQKAVAGLPEVISSRGAPQKASQVSQIHPAACVEHSQPLRRLSWRSPGRAGLGGKEPQQPPKPLNTAVRIQAQTPSVTAGAGAVGTSCQLC